MEQQMRVETIRLLGSALLLTALLAAPAAAQAPRGEAPFGDRVSERIPQYDRASPLIATAGQLGRLGIMEAKGAGFSAILNLGPEAGTGVEDQRMAEYARLRYFAIPVADSLPGEAQVAEFAALAEDSRNLPLLVYGRKVDQAAAMWALYRVSRGVAPQTAFEEALASGLDASSGALRQRLGLGD